MVLDKAYIANIPKEMLRASAFDVAIRMDSQFKTAMNQLLPDGLLMKDICHCNQGLQRFTEKCASPLGLFRLSLKSMSNALRL